MARVFLLDRVSHGFQPRGDAVFAESLSGGRAVLAHNMLLVAGCEDFDFDLLEEWLASFGSHIAHGSISLINSIFSPECLHPPAHPLATYFESLCCQGAIAAAQN